MNVNGISILVIFLISTICAFGQNIELTVNAESATRILEFLKNERSDITEAKRILYLKGTAGMLRHDSQFNNQMDEECFLNELMDPNSPSDAFGYKEIRNHLSTIQTTIQLLEDSLTQIAHHAENRLRSYSPSESQMIHVYFVLGGNSDAFTDDGNSFYLELQYFRDVNDIDGIICMVAHEVYHIIQERNFDHEKEKVKLHNSWHGAYMLIRNVYQEGSASLVGDPLFIEKPRGHALFLTRKYDRNLRKLDESFYLFESLLRQSINDPNEDLLYGIAFGAQWDSPMYFVGYEMCKQLERYHGREAIENYLFKPPTHFFLDYIHLYQSETAVQHKFSIQTEKVIRQIHAQLVN